MARSTALIILRVNDASWLADEADEVERQFDFAEKFPCAIVKPVNLAALAEEPHAVAVRRWHEAL